MWNVLLLVLLNIKAAPFSSSYFLRKLSWISPPEDEEAVMNIGRNLLEHTKYTSSFGNMFYKTDEQTDQGTRATGNKSNSKYRIPVPRQWLKLLKKPQRFNNECIQFWSFSH